MNKSLLANVAGKEHAKCLRPTSADRSVAKQLGTQAGFDVRLRLSLWPESCTQLLNSKRLQGGWACNIAA